MSFGYGKKRRKRVIKTVRNWNSQQPRKYERKNRLRSSVADPAFRLLIHNLGDVHLTFWISVKSLQAFRWCEKLDCPAVFRSCKSSNHALESDNALGRTTGPSGFE